MRCYWCLLTQTVFELPDGQLVHIDSASRYHTTEILFSPPESWEPAATIETNTSLSTTGVHELCFEAIVKCDNFLQRDLFRNVVLAGGTSTLKGSLIPLNFSFQFVCSYLCILVLASQVLPSDCTTSCRCWIAART